MTLENLIALMIRTSKMPKWWLVARVILYLFPHAALCCYNQTHNKGNIVVHLEINHPLVPTFFIFILSRQSQQIWRTLKETSPLLV
ncbi:hypothetical protein Goarm_001038 [Gossypium armourianum]|uniref:Uncharacterized protein n=1 Tax=Gossypium armourianum TaxID=34283 RepID=A0A7J9KBR7_9ROSI|nr:hypothetical protein [Gossypium armourianum]